MELEQVDEAVAELVEGVENFKGEFTERLDHLEARQNRADLPAGNKANRPSYRVLHTGGKKAFVLPHTSRLSDIPELKQEPEISLNRWCRALVFGNNCEDKEALEFLSEQKSVTTGSTGVLVPAGFVPEWIDMARAQSVLNRAGMMTVSMPEASLEYAHQTADPTIAWRSGEGISLNPSDPVFAERKLTAKTVAIRTQVSLEATQDIPNFGAQITAAYSKAFAAAIDGAGIAGSGDAPTGIQNTPGVNTVENVGTPANWDDVVDGVAAFLNANNSLDDVTGIIMHPDIWKVYAKLKTGIASDNTPLELPPAIEDVPRFVTTNAEGTDSPETFKITLGNFRDLVMGVRLNPTIRVLDATTSMASNLLVEIIGVARVDFLATRPASFTVLEDVTASG